MTRHALKAHGSFLFAVLGTFGCVPIDSPEVALESVRGAPQAAAPLADDYAGDPPLAGFDVQPLEIGAPVPAFALTDQSGARIDSGSLVGKAIVLTFFESRSPDPALCPELIDRLMGLGRVLRSDLETRVALIAVSVDPSHDTPEVLRSYAERRGVDATLLRFTSGEPGQIAALTGHFGVVSWPRDDGSVAHSLNTVVIGRGGSLFDQFPGVDGWSAEDLLAALVEAAER